MNEEASGVPAAAYTDKRGGLIGFGIVLIVIGFFCALFVPLMVLGQVIGAQATQGAVEWRILLPSVLLYAGMAVVFIWLGIGSIKARRWARALALILSWCWLLTGIMATVMTAVVMPGIFAHPPGGAAPPPAAVLHAILIALLAFYTVIFVLLPGALVLFYRSPHVRATCEARDPVRRWTDACPLPVLAASLMFGFGALVSLPMLGAFHCVMPFFGRLVSGAAGAGILVLAIAFWAWCAWALYRLKPAGWWASLAGFAVAMLSALMTFTRVDLIQLYEKMGYPEAQLEQFRQMPFLQGHQLMTWSMLCCLPVLGFLLYLKRYFVRRPS